MSRNFWADPKVPLFAKLWAGGHSVWGILKIMAAAFALAWGVLG